MKINSQKLQSTLQDALNESFHWAQDRKVNSADPPSNALRSSLFCSQAGKHIHPLVTEAVPNGVTLNRRQISVTDSGKKEAGEWLLDVVWTQDCWPDTKYRKAPEIPKKIWCALECEIDTAADALFIDLAKLLHINNPVKIFLGGLNQTTEQKALEYMDRRLMEIKIFLADDPSSWYVGFWPSPKGDRESSLWDEDKLPAHLEKVYLFELECHFQQVQ